MLDLRTKHPDKGTFFTKILFLNLIIISCFLFVIPEAIDTIGYTGMYWSWNYYLVPEELRNLFVGNVNLALLSSILTMIPGIFNMILAIVAFITAFKFNQQGNTKEIFRSNKILAAVYYGLATSIFSAIFFTFYMNIWMILEPSEIPSIFLNPIYLLDYILETKNLIPVIISVYVAILAWKIPRYQ
ncbi:MAG TPA: hypothetical protein VKM55_29355 [Candidatus Lokiarchaeia archaeon]|nr:hypothetical protein [Candidatus Lokiarchaeia archaeon]